MITFENGGRLVEDLSELPNLRDAHTIYADFETTSRDPAKKSIDPWRDCYTAGLAITVDDSPQAWYIPIEHHFGPRLDKEATAQWFADILYDAEVWANQNVKYDVHVAREDLGIVALPRLRCLLTGAKMVDSDMLYKGGYDLTNLAKKWLKHDISKYERKLQPYLGRHNKDYAAIPADICGEYACEDVLTARRLDRYEKDMIPEESLFIWDVEQQVTSILADAEREGLRVHPDKLKLTQLKLLSDMIAIEGQIHELTGEYVRPHVNADVFDLLCNYYGLPVLSWADGGNPSFDKEALAKYLVLPNAPTDVIRLLQMHRKKSTLKGFFVDAYLEKHIDGILHPSFNQLVRTGRMSCSNPNAQQLSEDAKELIEEDEDHEILCEDFSQIEYRVIAHYIKDTRIIDAYCTDPDVDFHDWVAKLCGMTRRPAKTVNFGAGYGMGRDKTSQLLALSEDVTGAIRDKVRQMVEAGEVPPEQQKDVFDKLALENARRVYDEYHANMPTLKRTARRAGQVARQRGYSRTLSGRRRHLAKESSHRAFNAVCQGFAADYMKERMVAVAKEVAGTECRLLAVVHDELVFRIPKGTGEYWAQRTIPILEDSSAFPSFRIPMRCTYGYGKTWKEASGGKHKVPAGDRFDRFKA